MEVTTDYRKLEEVEAEKMREMVMRKRMLRFEPRTPRPRSIFHLCLFLKMRSCLAKQKTQHVQPNGEQGGRRSGRGRFEARAFADEGLV
jgi:hypothetical protein